MLKVGILGGGPSVEHKVSLASARNVYESTDRTKYEPHLLILRRDKKLFSGKKELPFPHGLKQFDIVFNALHGMFGEDGKLQKIFDRTGIKYTGSGSRASALGMDKWRSKKLFGKVGLAVPQSKLITSRKHSNILQNIRIFPVVLKPRNGGSSVGVCITHSPEELKRKVDRILESDDALVEQYLPGREFAGGVLKYNDELRPFPIVEIKPKAKYKFFDYEAKYKTGASEEIVPARIDTALARKIQKAALLAHKVIGAKTYSRSDFIMHNGKIYILEINTLPGLTKNSLVPKAARATGIPFTKFISIVIDSALK